MNQGARQRSWARFVTTLALLGALVVAGLAARPFVLDELAIRKLASPDEDARKEAAKWLAKRECVRAIPALLAGGGGPFAFEPSYLATALEALKLRRAVPTLRVAARSGDRAAQRWALRALWQIGDRSEETFQASVMAAGEEDELVRLDGLMGLGRFGARALPHIMTFTRAPTAGLKMSLLPPPFFQAVAFNVLSLMGPSCREVIPELLATPSLDVGSDDTFVYLPHSTATCTLWSLGEDMQEADEERLEDEALEMRASAAGRLAHALAPDPRRDTAARMLASLARLPGQARRVRALMAPWKGPEGATRLLEAARDAAANARDAARFAFFETLAALDHSQPELLPILKPLLKAGDSGLQLQASRIAARIEGGEDLALGILLPRAEAGEAQAIDAVGEAGTAASRAAPALVRLLDDPVSHTRASAALALARVDPEKGSVTALQTLARWTQSTDGLLHDAASEALLDLPASASSVTVLSEILRTEMDQELLTLAALRVLALGEAGRPALAALKTALPRSQERARSAIIYGQILLGEPVEREDETGLANEVWDWLSLHVELPQGKVLASVLSRPAGLEVMDILVAHRPWARLPPPVPGEILSKLRDPRRRADEREQAAMIISHHGPAAAAAVPDIVALVEEFGQAGRLLPLLARIGPAAVPHLAKSLEAGASVELRGVLALALGRMGGAASAAALALVPLLDDANTGVREVAIDALGRMGRAASCAGEKLKAIASTGSESLRARAAKALERIDARPDGFPPLPGRYGEAVTRRSARDLHAAICTR